MKEHPVDTYFAEKLKDLELQPSAEVWNKIEHSLETKRKPWGLYFSIAASFAIILAIFSYVFLKPSSLPLEEQLFEAIQRNPAQQDHRPKTTQPAGTVPGNENSIPVMAQQGNKKTIAKHSNINRGVLAMADYNGDETEFRDNTIWPIDKIKLAGEKTKKKKYGVRIASANRYLEKDENNNETDNYRNALKSYSAEQWGHIKKREKLDALPLPDIQFPKIKFAKNPSTD